MPTIYWPPAASSSSGGQDPSQFAGYVAAAFASDTVLNWTGGDVILPAPIVLQATTSKFGFGIRGNGAKVTCNYNDTSKYAITIVVPANGAYVYQGVNVRNWTIRDLNFRGTSAFAGAISLECRGNGSWINSFLLSDITCENHTNYAHAWRGSVFECVGDRLKSTGGAGGLWIERADLNGNGDFGLPSAMELNSPNFRDGSSHGIQLFCTQAYTEPFDLTVRGGYIVSVGGNGIHAPAGITMVDGTGFENINGGVGVLCGYRGGIFRGHMRGANPIANALENGPGMRWLVYGWEVSGRLLLEDLAFENEGSGSGMALAYCSGSGTVFLNRCGPQAGVTLSGPTLVVQGE